MQVSAMEMDQTELYTFLASNMFLILQVNTKIDTANSAGCSSNTHSRGLCQMDCPGIRKHIVLGNGFDSFGIT